ncbi:replication protein A 70 kDa DNA-binding subunit C-like [Rutidosis leptorrhynchoides]|uniref:replication protein A 70 kDa DNA-binding subunit C-like n=1 Tax=Rutidosis leptorrhynchoides TaxID=125765 RepID=UPI003A99A95C
MTTNLQVVKSLSPKKPHVNIKLKVLEIETMSIKTFDQGKPFLDLIVYDEDGDRISLTIKHFLKAKYENILKPQNNYLFNRVFVNNNTSRSKNQHSNHACKLMLEAKTTVLPVESSDWSGDGGFKFISFADLLAKNLEEGVTADVIGMVTKFSEEKQYGNTDDEQSKYRVINLRDLEGLSLSCTLWGKFMRLFYNYVNSEEEKQCVILIL